MSDWQQPAPEGTPPPEPPLFTVRDPIWGWRDVFFFAGMFVPCFLLPAAAITSLLRYGLKIENKALLLLPGQFIGYGLWLYVLARHLRSSYGIAFGEAMRWRLTGEWISRGAFSGAALALFVAFSAVALKTPQVKGPFQEMLNDPSSRVLFGVAAVLLAPICEELIFRGFLLPLLARSIGWTAAVLAGALPFSLMHGQQYNWTWQSLLLLWFAGAVFGWVRMISGSTAVTAVQHSFYNLTFFIAYITAKGTSST